MHRRLAGERGAIGLWLLLAIYLAFLLLPYFLDLAAVYFARVVTVTAADSSALAAAVSLAEQLSVKTPLLPQHWTDWAAPPEDADEDELEALRQEMKEDALSRAVLTYYADVYQPTLESGLGLTAARDLAGRNEAELVQFEQVACRPVEEVAGYQLDTLELQAITRRAPALLWAALYERQISVASPARARAYLDGWSAEYFEETRADELRVRAQVGFQWKVGLLASASCLSAPPFTPAPPATSTPAAPSP